MMRFDADFSRRAARHLGDLERDRLKAVLMPDGWDDGKPEGARAALGARVDALWTDARAGGLRRPLSQARFTLVMLTRPRWEARPSHRAYAARMIGTTDRRWTLEDGINAVFRHVVAPHDLRPDVAAHIAARAAGDPEEPTAARTKAGR